MGNLPNMNPKKQHTTVVVSWVFSEDGNSMQKASEYILSSVNSKA